MPSDLPVHSRSTGLVDVLDRVLDKGLVIAGDIKVSLAEVELLTIRIRLLVCSLDKAQEIGLDWWRYDRALSPGAPGGANRALQEQISALEKKVEMLIAATAGAAAVDTRPASQVARRARRRK